MQRNIYLLPLLALLLVSHARARSLCFDGAVNYTAGSNPVSVFAADLDGDGDQDLAVANYTTGNNVSVLKNNGDGTFAAAVNYAAGTYPRSVIAADLDGDGDLDLAVVGGGSVSVLKNNGDGTFAAAVNYVAGSNPVSVFAADLDGDRDQDLALANDNNPGTVSVLKNNGDGTFAAAVDYDAAGAEPYSVFAADLDGDGDRDLAVAVAGSAGVAVLKNNGDGTFAAAVIYSAGSVPWSVFAADLDGNGDQDLAVANFGGNVSVLKNNGDGTFAGAVNYAAGTNPRSVFAADLDGDGKLDLAVTNQHSDNISVLKNNGDGTFAAAVNYAAGSNPYAVAAADLDGGGAQDLAVVNPGSINVSVLINCVHIPQALRVPQSYASIQAAIDAAKNEDTVLVSPGTYTEHIDFTGKGIVVKSVSGPQSTEIVGFVPGVAVVEFHSGEDSSSCLSGFTVTGGGSGTRSGIYCSSAHPVIEHNVVRNNSGAGIYSDLGGPTLLHNTVVNNSGDGISWWYGAGGKAKNNIIAFNIGWGMHREGSTSVSLTYNDVYGNVGGNYYGIAPSVGSISLDPEFCDSTTGDYSLFSGSPCVTAGEGGTAMGALAIGCLTPSPEQPTVQRIGIDLPGDSLHVANHAPAISWGYLDPHSRPHTKSEIEVGTDNDWAVAEMWQPSTIVGSDTSIQYAGLPLVDGATYYVRVRVFNDTLWSPWRVAPFRMNGIPTAPSPLFPSDGSVALAGRPNLVVMNATDAESDIRHYDFEVYRDSALTQLASYISGKTEGFGQTSWRTDSLTAENQRHWWRARASDGYENGPWSPIWSFVVDAYNQPPAVFNLLTPADGAVVYDLTPPLAWRAAIDPDPGANLTYTLTIGININFTFKSEVSGVTDTTFDWPDSLENGRTYWWKVKANDGRGGTATSAVRSFKTRPLGDQNGDGTVNLPDVVMLINYVFRGGLPPNPRSIGDVNGDCVINVLDVVYLIDHVFRSGPAPVTGCA